MTSYQNFIATISNALTFNLRSQDGRYVRLANRTLLINSRLENRRVLHLDNNPGQATTLVLKAFPNNDNFNLFIETRNAQNQDEPAQEFPINIILDEATGAQFLQVDDTRSGSPLRIDPDVSIGVITQFVEFRVFGPEPTPTIVEDAFGFLRVGGGALVPKFGFESLLPNIHITTADNWEQILPFILNGATLAPLVQSAKDRRAETITGAVVGGILLILALPVAIISMIALTVILGKLAFAAGAIFTVTAVGGAVVSFGITQILELNGLIKPGPLANDLLINATNVLKSIA